MGLFPLVLPAFLLGSRLREEPKPHDPEKGIRAEPHHIQDSPDLDHDDSDDEHDPSSEFVFTSNTPHHRPRRVYSNFPKAAPAGPTPPDTPSDDVEDLRPSLYKRIKAYVWPSEDERIEEFVPNYRWTPIISGIVIPFSILLEIPGLTVRWYIKTEDHQTVDTKPNPVILDVGLAISLACALIANICLVLRFLEKRVQTATLMCIISLTIHGVFSA